MPEKFTIDSESVRSLAELLNETELSEIEYQVGDHRVRLVKGSAPVVGTYVAPAPAVAPAVPVVSAPVAPVPAEAPAAPGEAVTSPMVGVAYMAGEPGAAPFVKVGSQVNVGDTLLIIEAMKVMNLIKATKAGTVVEVCVGDGSPVEFGQPLIRVA